MELIVVGHTNKVSIICPGCGLESKKNVFKFRTTHKNLKARCKCGEIFRFTLDFRKYYRKNVRLTGDYFVQGKGEKGVIFIKDISKTGVKFATLEPHNFSEGDLVELKFNLDDPMSLKIRTRVKIVWIDGRTVGSQFNDPRILEKDLGLYLIK